MKTIRRHIIIVILLLWVVLTQFIVLPWAPVVSDDSEPVFHDFLLLSDAYEKPRSYAYDAVALDSIAPLSRREPIVVYVGKYNSSDRWRTSPNVQKTTSLSFDSTAPPYRAGDVITTKTKIESGRAFVKQNESAILEHRTWRQIGLTEGKIQYLALRCRNAVETLFKQHFNGVEEQALVNALLLGDKRALSPDQRNAFTDAGAMHVLAVSGLHVGVVKDVIVFLLTLGGLLYIPWEKKWLRLLQKFVIILFVWAYAFLTGMSVSVMRSALMFSFLPLAQHQLESSLKYNRIAAAALVILLINPNALYSPSFLLSFSAVLAIMYYVPIWKKRFRISRERLRAFNSRKRLRTFNGGERLRAFNRGKCAKILQPAYEGLAVSVAAQIGVLPWTLYFFGQMSNYFALTNIVIVPLTWLTVVASIIALISSLLPIPPAATAICFKASNRLAWAMNSYVKWIQHLHGATSFFSFNSTLTALLICFIITVSIAAHYFFEKRKTAWFWFAASCLIAITMLCCYNAVVTTYHS